MRYLLMPAVLLALALSSCSKDTAEPSDAETATQLPADAPVHAVACGCSLEDGGDCGNFVEVDGEFIPLAGLVGLGAMEFCGQEGLHAAMTGEVVDGTFMATAYALRE